MAKIDKNTIIASLKRLLDKGEITQGQYDEAVAKLK
jgi:hypothetical protein